MPFPAGPISSSGSSALTCADEAMCMMEFTLTSILLNVTSNSNYSTVPVRVCSVSVSVA